MTGNLEAARKTYKSWSQVYPRDKLRLPIWGSYAQSGRLQQSPLPSKKSKTGSRNGISYTNLVAAYLVAQPLDEAKATAQKAQDHNLDSLSIQFSLYRG